MLKSRLIPRAVVPLSLLVALSGCVHRKAFETEPVRVSTSDGTVICQLYTHERVWWDRSIQRPSAMTEEAADDICIREGKHRLGER